ncbi:MAG TPA: nitroreductase family protein [Pseudorhizobium sp.]|jgi:nitroreductase|nr:nitroreductase family protein [Pseudorhizobium sp.]
MKHPGLALIEKRASTSHYDAAQSVSDTEIENLVRLATRAPSAYNLQNWRFIAVRSPERKAQLCALAYGQTKVEAAAVTFIVCGVLPNSAMLPARLQPFVDAGYMPADMPAAWQAAASRQYSDERTARDEAIRSASLGAATLMFAAEALGLASGPMVGFDAASLADEFDLEADEVPVMLVTVGRAAPGNWPQKPRREIEEVLQFS